MLHRASVRLLPLALDNRHHIAFLRGFPLGCPGPGFCRVLRCEEQPPRSSRTDCRSRRAAADSAATGRCDRCRRRGSPLSPACNRVSTRAASRGFARCGSGEKPARSWPSAACEQRNKARRRDRRLLVTLFQSTGPDPAPEWLNRALCLSEDVSDQGFISTLTSGQSWRI